jgi:hypothetical protein
MARCDDDGRGPVDPEPAARRSYRELVDFAATVRAESAVGARRRERWLRQQACEEVSLLAACWNLAEAGRTVLVTTRAATTRRGQLRLVGEDYVALADEQRREHLVPLAGIATLRAVSAGRSALDAPAGRPIRSGARLVEALASLAGERPLLSVTCEGRGGSVRGELIGAGTDVVVMGPPGGVPGMASAVYVRLSSVAELSLMASG